MELLAAIYIKQNVSVITLFLIIFLPSSGRVNNLLLINAWPFCFPDRKPPLKLIDF